MQSQMDQKKFLGFYKNTVLAYSNSFQATYLSIVRRSKCNYF